MSTLDKIFLLISIISNFECTEKVWYEFEDTQIFEWPKRLKRLNINTLIGLLKYYVYYPPLVFLFDSFTRSVCKSVIIIIIIFWDRPKNSSARDSQFDSENLYKCLPIFCVYPSALGIKSESPVSATKWTESPRVENQMNQ